LPLPPPLLPPLTPEPCSGADGYACLVALLSKPAGAFGTVLGLVGWWACWCFTVCVGCLVCARYSKRRRHLRLIEEGQAKVAPTVSSPGSSASHATNDPAEKLITLKRLYDLDAITLEEYHTKKTKVLTEM